MSGDFAELFAELELQVAGFEHTHREDDIAVLFAADCGVAIAVAADLGVYCICIDTASGVVSFDIPTNDVRALSREAAAVDYRREVAAMRKKEPEA